MKNRIKINYEKLGVLFSILFTIFCFFLMCGNRHKKEGVRTYSVEGTGFTPTVKWMSDSVYRIYLHRKDMPFTNDYIELKSTKPMVEHFCTTYNRLIMYYNEDNSKDVYMMITEDKTLLNVKADNFNVFHYEPQHQGEHVTNGQLISYGGKKLPKLGSPQFSDSLYYHTQYHWVFTDGNREINVYLDRNEVKYNETKEQYSNVALPGGYFDTGLVPYYYLADYQSNVMGVHDGKGNLEQQVDHYPYGEPWLEPEYTKAGNGNCYVFGDKERILAVRINEYDFGALSVVVRFT